MIKKPAINKDPFDYLNAYQEQSFTWAVKVWDKIKPQFSESIDLEMVSVTLANIYSDFLHVALGYHDDFENYLTERYGREKARINLELSPKYRAKIYNAMLSKYGENDKISDSLIDSIVIKDGDDTFHNPLNDSQELAVSSFVSAKFNY